MDEQVAPPTPLPPQPQEEPALLKRSVVLKRYQQSYDVIGSVGFSGGDCTKKLFKFPHCLVQGLLGGLVPFLLFIPSMKDDLNLASHAHHHLSCGVLLFNRFVLDSVLHVMEITRH